MKEDNVYLDSNEYRVDDYVNNELTEEERYELFNKINSILNRLYKPVIALPAHVKVNDFKVFPKVEDTNEYKTLLYLVKVIYLRLLHDDLNRILKLAENNEFKKPDKNSNNNQEGVGSEVEATEEDNNQEEVSSEAEATEGENNQEEVSFEVEATEEDNNQEEVSSEAEVTEGESNQEEANSEAEFAEEEISSEDAKNINKSDFLNNISELLNKEEDNNSEDQSIEISKSKEDIDLIILKNLINRFLKHNFKEKKTDLNERAKTDSEKTYGYYYWDKKKIARHLTTKEYTKVLNDKYDVAYSKGKSDNVPLAFYFDLSGSMDSYTTLLAQISYHLLRNDIKVLIGYNETIYYQINEIESNISFKDLTDYYNNDNSDEFKGIKREKVTMDIDKYLKEKMCEQCVVFSDSDSYDEVCNLSKFANVYLLYFTTYGNQRVDENFNGCVYKIDTSEDVFNALRSMSITNYNVLKQKSLVLKRKGVL